MRSTYTGLQNTSLKYCQTDSTDTAVLAFVKEEINTVCREIFSELQQYVDHKTQTTSTVAAQQYYHYPPDLVTIQSVQVTIGSVTFPLEVVDNKYDWDRRNALVFSGSAFPALYFPRQSDFGIWPIPQDAYVLTLTYVYRLADLSFEDYTTGTITLTNNSQTVTGSGTTFTANMVGKWLKSTADGYWYRISAYNSTTSLTLEEAYQGSTGASLAYIIGDSPEIPPEIHTIIPYRVASRFYSGLRSNMEKATWWENMYYTGDGTLTSRSQEDAKGGLLGAQNRYSRRSVSRVIKSKKDLDPFAMRAWATVISS